MERIFTETEMKAVLEAESSLRAKGLIVDYEDGKELAEHNGERISAFFDLNPTIPVTVETVLAACEQMRSQMNWKSSAQMAYEREYNKLTEEQKNAFGSWWYRQKSVLILDGDQGFDNATKILAWMHGRTIDDRGLDLAVSNLAASSGLHLVYQSTFRPSIHSGQDRSFAPKSETNLTVKDHARRAAEARKDKTVTPEPATDYRGMAEAIKGRTHSATQQIQRVYVMEPGTSQINWEKTYAARRRAAGL